MRSQKTGNTSINVLTQLCNVPMLLTD